jgi:hypothetical protein
MAEIDMALETNTKENRRRRTANDIENSSRD